METMLNFATQQVKNDMPSSQQKRPTSLQGDNGRNKDDDQQFASATIQNVEEAPPAFGGGAQFQDSDQQAMRKCYSRHSQHQIKEMESFFEECPHPNEKQRGELGNLCGLNSAQINFLFQNKRTRTKAMMKRHKNTLLIAENYKLCAENLKFKESLSKAKSDGYGGSHSISEMFFKAQELRLEDARLKEEIKNMAAKNSEKPARTSFSNLPPPPYTQVPSRSLNIVNCEPQTSMEKKVYSGSEPQWSIITTPFTETEKANIMELAVDAMKEFRKMARDEGALWIPGIHNEILNQQEYVSTFNVGIGHRPLGFRSEASRKSMVVFMDPNSLIKILMDVNEWSIVFPTIISRARITETISAGGERKYDGALQAMSAEFQVLSHLVPTCDSYFIRYSKYHTDGAWAVVDISLDNMRPGAATRCKRQPSGCMIQELSNGFSKVTWIEHVVIEDREMHDIFKHLFNSGFVFGVRRWIASLDRYCERLAYTMATNINLGDLCEITPEGKKNLMNLALKIMQSYCNYVGASPPPLVWTIHTTLPTGVDDVRVMTRNQTDKSFVISVATSFSLPVSSKKLFDFLRDENSRNQWDILTNKARVQELAHIAHGHDHGNYVSILHVNRENSGKKSTIIVQETCTDSTGSYVVYAPVEVGTLKLVLNGANLDTYTVLSSGFAIFPDGLELGGGPIPNFASRGCLCTFSHQILVEEPPTPLPPSIVSLMCNFIKATIRRIQAPMMSVNT